MARSPAQRVSEADRVLANAGQLGTADSDLRVLDALVQKGDALADLGRADDAVACFERAATIAITDVAEPRVRQTVAGALTALVVQLARAGRHTGSVKRADELQARFRHDPDPAVQRALRDGLLAGVDACEAMMSGEAGRGGTQPPSAVATAMWARSDWLGHLQGAEAEVSALTQLIDRFADATDIELQLVVAQAMYNRAVVLRDAGQGDAAIAAWTAMTTRFLDDPPAKSPLIAMDGLYAMAQNLFGLGRWADAIANCDELDRRYSERTELHVRRTIASTLGIKRDALEEAGAIREAIATDDEIAQRFRIDADVELQERVGRALRHKASFSLGCGDPLYAIAAADDLLCLFEATADTSVAVRLGGHLIETAITLLGPKRRRLGRHPAQSATDLAQEEGLKILSRVVSRSRDDATAVLHMVLPRALIEKSNALARLGRIDEALATYEEVLRLGPPAAAAFDEIANSVRDGSPWSEERKAQALGAKATALASAGHNEEAATAFRAVIQQFHRDSSPLLKIVVSDARQQLKALLS
jgi:tetratricopeptide (TPR) repeat protein